MRISIIVPVLILASACGGCGILGKGSPKKENQVAADGHVAEALNLRIVGASGGDSQLPDNAADLHSERKADTVTAAGDELIFNRLIMWDKPLFLVWDEAALGSIIQDVSVDHRMEDEHNQVVGNVEHKVAYYEPTKKRWYVRIADLIGADQYGAEPARQHLLTLDLKLADGSRHLIFVKFRAAAPGGRFKTTNLESGYAGGSNLFAEAQVFSKGERVVARTELTNPYDRSESFWVRPSEKSNLTLVTLIGQQTYGQDHSSPPIAQPITWLQSEGSLVVGSVGVKRRSGAPAKLLMNESSGARIELGTHETVTLEWMASPAKTGSAPCSLPPPGSVEMRWMHTNGDRECTAPTNLFPGPSCKMWVQTDAVPEPWVIGGLHIRGNWAVDVQSSSPAETAPSSEVTVLGDTASESVGIKPAESNGAFSCQGLF